MLYTINMREPILHDPVKYVTNIAEIVDNFDGKKFIDTSMIITIPILLFDPEKKEYKGINLALLSNMLKYYSNTAKYNQISSGIIKNTNEFYENLFEVIKPEIMITPAVSEEIKESIRHQDMLRTRNEETYRAESREVFYKGKAWNKTGRYASKNNPTIPFKIGEKIYKMNKSRMPRIKKTMNDMLSIERKFTEEMLESSKDHVEIYQDLNNKYSEMYNEILSATTEAFDRYKRKSSKNHKNSSDHKILAETILYSHLLGKNILFLTSDGDYKWIAAEMRGLKTNRPLMAKVNIINRVIPKNHHIMPYFEKASIITYDDGFKVM